MAAYSTYINRNPTISALNDALRPGFVLRIRQVCLTVSRHFSIPFRNRVRSNSPDVPFFRHPSTGMAIATEETRRGQPTSRGGRVCVDTRHRQTPCAPYFDRTCLQPGAYKSGHWIRIGRRPEEVWIVTGPVGLWAFIFDVPKWVLNAFT